MVRRLYYLNQWLLILFLDFDLKGVEFSTLPSGLHLVPQDVV